MDADGQAHQERDEDDPAVGVRPVSLLVPLGHGIDLAFDRGEPEGVREAVRKGSDSGAAHHGNGPADGVFAVTAWTDDTLGEENDGQIQQEDGQGGTQRVHYVNEQRGVHVVPEHREYPGN